MNKYDENFGLTAAFAGMKADSAIDRVDSYPAAEFIPFGIFVALDEQGRVKVPKTAGEKIIGVSVHSHGIVGDGYQKHQSVSVMTLGSIWVKSMFNPINPVRNASLPVSVGGWLGAPVIADLGNAVQAKFSEKNVDGLQLIELRCFIAHTPMADAPPPVIEPGGTVAPPPLGGGLTFNLAAMGNSAVMGTVNGAIDYHEVNGKVLIENGALVVPVADLNGTVTHNGIANGGD